MPSHSVGVYRETKPGERRVALVPQAVPRIQSLGLDVLIESTAGRAAGFADDRYADSGARIMSRHDLFDRADILVGVCAPNVPLMHRFRSGQFLICVLQPLRIPPLVRHWAHQGLTAMAVDLLPPGFSRVPVVTAGSDEYAETVVALLGHLVREGTVTIDLADPIQAAIVVTYRRNVVNDAVWQLILDEIGLAGLP
jgi:NAD/NADP transhydrogenase alpha subunit